MNSQKVLFNIYGLPILGDLLCYLGYVLLGWTRPPVLWLAGHRRVRCGTSTVWVPESKRQVILDGIEWLRGHDAEMFMRFTKKQRLVIYYSRNWSDTNSLGHVFGLHDRYIALGAEGVAFFIVQSVLLSAAAPSLNQCRLSDSERNALKVAPRKAMEWMEQHSFHPKLINAYSKMAENWEQSERFQ